MILPEENTMKKIIILLLILSLFACSAKPNDNTNVSGINVPKNQYQYVERLKNYEVKERRKDDIADNQEFDNYLTELYKDTMQDDYLSMHFGIEDYESFGITKPEVTIGELSYDFVAEIEETEEELKKLQSFDYNSLSYRQQVDYSVMEYSYLETLASLAYGNYSLLFDNGVSLHSNLITNFTEYVFRSDEDVEDYLILLQDIDRYLDDAVEYTNKQAELGIALQDYSLDETLEYIDGFIAKVEDNELIVSFDNKIDLFDGIDEVKKEEYKAQNKEIVIDEVIKAYSDLKDSLEDLRGKSRLDGDDAGAYEYDKGYGEMLVYLNASNNMELDELYDEIYDILVDELIDMLTIAEENPDDYEDAIDFIYEPSTNEILEMDFYDALDYLANCISQDYPEIGNVNYEISLLDPSVANPNILAYYVEAPYDNPDHNVVRVNPTSLNTGTAFSFATLAHEGFPGHLYQHAYYSKVGHNPARDIMSFIAYGEGQAMFAEIDAYNYLKIGNENVTFVVAFNDFIFPYIIEAIAEMGVNGYGWSKEDLKDNLSTLVNLDDDGFEAIYEGAVSGAGSLIPYGTGLAQFIELEKDFIEETGLNNKKEFRELILKNGEMPFVILEDIIDEYVD